MFGQFLMLLRDLTDFRWIFLMDLKWIELKSINYDKKSNWAGPIHPLGFLLTRFGRLIWITNRGRPYRRLICIIQMWQPSTGCHWLCVSVMRILKASPNTLKRFSLPRHSNGQIGEIPALVAPFFKIFKYFSRFEEIIWRDPEGCLGFFKISRDFCVLFGDF